MPRVEGRVVNGQPARAVLQHHVHPAGNEVVQRLDAPAGQGIRSDFCIFVFVLSTFQKQNCPKSIFFLLYCYTISNVTLVPILFRLIVTECQNTFRGGVGWF